MRSRRASSSEMVVKAVLLRVCSSMVAAVVVILVKGAGKLGFPARVLLPWVEFVGAFRYCWYHYTMGSCPREMPGRDSAAKAICVKDD